MRARVCTRARMHMRACVCVCADVLVLFTDSGQAEPYNKKKIIGSHLEAKSFHLEKITCLPLQTLLLELDPLFLFHPPILPRL